MNELQAQSLMVDAVRQYDGFAFKLSNRFLKGVSDLFIKMVGLQPWFYEVKIRDLPRDWFQPDLTPLQHKFLKDYEATGGNSGIAMFLRHEQGLSLLLTRYRTIENGMFNPGAARFLPRGKREQTIYEYLGWINDGRN